LLPVSKEKCKTLGISLPVWNDNPARTAQAIVKHPAGSVPRQSFKSERKSSKERAWNKLIYSDSGQDEAIARASHICAGVILARELVAAPANSVTPITMAETAQAIALEHDRK